MKVDYCSHAAAKYAVEHWHYSKSLPVPPIISYGVWEEEQFIGTVIFSRGASSNIHKPFNVEMFEIAELTRIALTTHKTFVTKIISICLKLLKKKELGLKLIISYADPNHNHVGTIYQASNFYYLGRTTPTEKFVDRNGRIWHSRQVKSNGLTRQFGELRLGPKRSECICIREQSKHKYAFPIDESIRITLKNMSQPYPKASVVQAQDNPQSNGKTTPEIGDPLAPTKI